MKIISSLIILALASPSTAFSANNKKAPIKKKIPTKKPGSGEKKALSRRDLFIAAGAATIASTFWDVEFLEVVKDKSPLPPINGIYSDPQHSNGYRVVRTTSKTNAIVTLQDEPPNGPIINVDGKIKSSKKGTTITLDLSAKGGPSDLVATFSEGTGGNQIIFPDSNAWTQLEGANGIYSDPNHKEGYRVVRVEKNKMYISLQDEPNADVIDVVGTKKGDAFLIDFSAKGGPKDIEAKVVDEGKSISFPDGNSWTRL